MVSGGNLPALFQINPHNDEMKSLLSEFNKMDLSLDPVKIVHYSFVSYDYFEHLYLSNINFYKEVRRIIQAAKQDYSLLMEKSIRYERIYKNEPLNKERVEVAKMSAKVQGLREEATSRE